MTRVEGEIVVNRPVEEVFDFAADERHEPRFNPNMLEVEKLTPGPIGKGTRFRTEIKTRSRTAQMTVEFTDYDRPGRLSSISRLANMTIEGTLTFDSIAEGTRMRWSWNLVPRGISKFATPIVPSVGRRQERTIRTNLKRLLEEPR